jgi:hypothetical protein
MREIREGVSWATTIPADQVMVHVTHTHSGPDFQGLWGGVPADYRQYLVDRAVEAGMAAVAGMADAELRVGVVAEEDLHSNRRGWGFTDDTLAVLQAVDTEDGSTIATLVNYAAHPVVIGMSSRLVATDYVGGLVAEVEEELGGVAVFVNGAQGDVSPRAPAGADAYERAELLGRAIGARALDAVAVAEPLPHAVETSSERVTFAVDNAAFRFAASSSLVDLDSYYDFTPVGDPADNEYEVESLFTGVTLGTAWRTVRLATFPGEALTRLAIEARASVGCDEQFLLGTTQDSLGYLIPRDEWMTDRNGNYEESVSLEELAGQKTLGAIDALFDDCPEPDPDPTDPDPTDPDPTDPDPTDPDPTDPSPPVPAPFVDVEGVHAANIRTLQVLGIVQGVTADRYEPRAPVRRGQLASMLARMLRLDPVASGPFTDVAGSVHEGSINALAAAGIALGTGLEGRFEPNALIRRDQVAALIGRALEVEPVASGPFRDVVGNTHEGWINALAEAGVVRGFAPDRFGPREDVRRDAVASMLARALGVLDAPGAEHNEFDHEH